MAPTPMPITPFSDGWCPRALVSSGVEYLSQSTDMPPAWSRNAPGKASPLGAHLRWMRMKTLAALGMSSLGHIPFRSTTTRRDRESAQIPPDAQRAVIVAIKGRWFRRLDWDVHQQLKMRHFPMNVDTGVRPRQDPWSRQVPSQKFARQVCLANKKIARAPPSRFGVSR